MKTLLHVGCGPLSLRDLPAFFRSGDWDEIRTDINPDVRPDLVADSRDLSLLDDAAVDAVYSSHNIEHVWSFEVPVVLREFRRVLKDDGLLVIMCPDIRQVAQAVADGRIDEPLYVSPAGPITAIDILYGFQKDIAAGNEYMAHKMAFTADSLARHLLDAGFSCAVILRDGVFGLHGLACGTPAPRAAMQQVAEATSTHPQHLLEGLMYGEFAD
jgi:SAM-dependent methyltransferase